jgi:hypothetical protein
MKPRKPACQAINGVQYRNQIPMVQKCQQGAIHFVEDIHLCGTHFNALYREGIKAVVDIGPLELEAMEPAK